MGSITQIKNKLGVLSPSPSPQTLNFKLGAPDLFH
jgi:hypothetical protein